MISLSTQIVQKTDSASILQRVVERDKTAVKDCIDTYGNFIWSLAKKYTASTEEAETAAQEIFIDIWRHCERSDKTQFVQEKLIAVIALRRLLKYSRQTGQKYMFKPDVLNEQE